MLYPSSVASIVRSALPWTLALQIPAILVGWLVGNVLGAVAAYKRGVFDRTIFTTALAFSRIPYYCLAIILVYLLAITWPVFPVAGGLALASIRSGRSSLRSMRSTTIRCPFSPWCSSPSAAPQLG